MASARRAATPMMARASLARTTKKNRTPRPMMTSQKRMKVLVSISTICRDIYTPIYYMYIIAYVFYFWRKMLKYGEC